MQAGVPAGGYVDFLNNSTAGSATFVAEASAATNLEASLAKFMDMGGEIRLTISD